MKIRFYNIAYFFRLAFQGIFRNGLMSLATVFILISSLLVTGCTWLLNENIDYNLKELNEYNKIVVFMDKEADEPTIKLIKETIENFDSVKSVEWTTKDQVLRSLIEIYGEEYKELLDYYDNDNPCKDQLTVTYSDSSKVDTIVYKIENMNGQQATLNAVSKINDRRGVAQKLDNIKNVAGLIFTWLVVLLCIVSVFIIMNTIKLTVFARRDEVEIMRYVGATGFFVSFPFVLEGIIIGLVSSGIAFAAQYYIYRYFAQDIVGSSGLVTVIPFSELVGFVVAGFLGIGIGLGVIGSLISLRKYNKA